MENLFSYGTLQLESVQHSTFNRLLDGQADSLVGYKISHLEIKDPDVIAASGLTHHLIISHTGNNADVVKGVVFKVTQDELVQADEYEAEEYKRIQVRLQSGKQSWVYVSVNDMQGL